MPKARITDPDTSHIAARRITRHHMTKEINFILTSLLRYDYSGLTDNEMKFMSENQGKEFSPSGLRTRRHELCVLGLIESNQTKEVEDAKFKLWILTTRGKRVIDWLNQHTEATEQALFPWIEDIIQNLIQQDQSHQQGGMPTGL